MDHQSVGAVDQRRRPIMLALGVVVIGGAIGWSCALAGLGAWGLAVGAGVTLSLIVGFARHRTPRGQLGILTVNGFAFVLLTWPLLWLIVGYARYLVTGQSLGQ